LFLYFIKDNINWEKRKIKEEFFPKSKIKTKIGSEMYFPYRLDEQQKKRKDISPEKVQAKYDGGNWAEVKKEKGNVDRFKSPITFKPILIETNKKLRFYIILNQKSLEHLLTNYRDFIISTKYGKPFHISMPDKFSLTKYFEFVKKIELEKIVEDKFQDSIEFKILENILNQLQP